MQAFTPWETATHVPASSRTGFLPLSTLMPLTLLLALCLSALLWQGYGMAGVAMGLLFGRLMALDLTTYTLPNIYTVPLLAVGMVYAALHGMLWQALTAAVGVYLLAEVLRRAGAARGLSTGMGGGDLKLLAALFAFLPVTEALFALALGSFIWLPVAFAKPKLSVPFGVPIVIGWVLLLRLPHLPNWLMSAIS